MSNISDKTKGLIIIGDKLYKLNATDLKLLDDLNNNRQVHTRGNKFIWANNTSQFLDEVTERYKSIGTIYGIYP